MQGLFFTCNTYKNKNNNVTSYSEIVQNAMNRLSVPVINFYILIQ